MKVTVKTSGGEKKPLNVEAEELSKKLRDSTSAEVRFDDGSRALYSTAGGNYRQIPIGVVIPKTVQDIVQTVALCREFGAPVLPRGGGTSLAGQCCNVAVIIDCSKYLRGLLELDPQAKRARVQPGIVLDDLRNAAEKHHLTFAPDPSTHDHCTLGGMIGNNSCGVHSVMGGKTVDNTEELRVLTYDGLQLTVGATSDEELAQIINAGGRRGEIYKKMRDLRDKYADQIRARYPKIPRRVSGYNLDQLLPENGFHVARALVGTEGTCVTVLEGHMRLVDSPPVRTLVMLGYPDVYSAGDHVTQILEFGPIGLEGMDDRLIMDMKKKHLHPEKLELPEGKGWLLVEFGGKSKEEAEENAKRMMEALKKLSDAPSMKLFDNKEEEQQVWKTREGGLGATAFVPGSPVTWEGWEDAAVPPAQLGSYLRDFRALLDRYKYGCDLYGHFGDGCVHTRIDFDFFTAKGIATYRSFVHDAAHLVVKYGGSLSGEHGDGQSRAELLPIMFGEELINAFREFKTIWDPQWKMNPGKVVDPYRVDENLRLGTSYAPHVPKTHFAQFGDDKSFTNASMRCVGVGKCRRENEGTMCPSYMVTHEEEHSTRGRSRLLFEIMRGDFLKDEWRDKSVKNALDLCLSCKGCRSECPVNVDMATYKSEFLSHYYAGRLRPPNAYAIGLIHWWSRMASHAPGVVNAVMQNPVLGSIAKRLAKVSTKRQMPRFAAKPFTRAWKTNGRHNGQSKPGPARGRVILWPDTFNNFFEPHVLHSAAQVLQYAGYQVQLPAGQVCCGRPLYDYGMLTTAKRLLKNTIHTLLAEIRAGVPLVIMEPSCAAVFRDELKNMLPHDEDANRLSQQTFVFSEFIDKHHLQLPRLENRKALVQVHCHHKSVMKADAEQKLLKQLGIDFEILDSGCCGMAGGFGYEADHYDVSVAVGERVLLPAVRAAAQNTLLIADGFSCREQILQLTGRNAFHPCQVAHMAINEQRETNKREERKAA